MKEHTDILIIGAGPAGISAAITLQKQGIPNIVIDKSSFPREKVCGGLVTIKTRKVLRELLGAGERMAKAFCDSSDKVEIYSKTNRLAVSSISKKLRFVKRSSFDAFLAEHYKKLGGRISENEKNYEIDFLKQEIRLQNGNTISYKKLIAADGALSVTRKKAGYPDQKLSFCLEAYAPKSMLKNPGRTRIYFGIMENGYAWVFPSGREVCIGIGGEYDKSINYINTLKRLLKKLGISPDLCRIRGAFVPSGEITDQIAGRENVILAGDAGGFVDPIYGEGLYYALSSGIAAAKACASSRRDVKKAFTDYMSEHIKMIKQANRLKKVFFSKTAQRLFKARVYGKNTFLGFYCDNQVSTYRYKYGDLPWMYIDYKAEDLRYIIKRLLKLPACHNFN